MKGWRSEREGKGGWRGSCKSKVEMEEEKVLDRQERQPDKVKEGLVAKSRKCKTRENCSKSVKQK